MKRLILGTAGHIDHGKTTLVRALTGVDTDRLKEEKERGITIDLGFAEFGDEEVQLGIVDVPGHEGFIRNMLAGATGMDVVLLVVAADEGVMPQTREHLAILRLLGIERLVVALTKADLVESDWLELVREEVTELLDGALGPAASGIRILSVSAESGEGMEALVEAIRDAVTDASRDAEDDVARLPIDRVFTVRGTGTVVTGTLWSGRLESGRRVWLRPGELEARIRGLQVHGRDVDSAVCGERTAVALSGPGVDRASVFRGEALLDLEAWPETHMLTTRVEILEGAGWSLEHNQRVRVHLGTAEIMARTVILEVDRRPEHTPGRPLAPGPTGDVIAPGGRGWIQLRLEAPVAARAGDHLVLRSYSPMTTIGGGVVAEPLAPKRSRITAPVKKALASILEGDAAQAVLAALELSGPEGADVASLPVVTGYGGEDLHDAVSAVTREGGVTVAGRLFPEALVRSVEAMVLEIVEHGQEEHPLRPGTPLEALRDRVATRTIEEADASVADRSPVIALVDRVVADLSATDRLEITDGFARAPGFTPELTADQTEARNRLTTLFREAGASPPTLAELPDELRERSDFWPLLRLLETSGSIRRLDEELYFAVEAIDEVITRVRTELGGRAGLGPADFKEVVPVTRKYLMPLLGHLDGLGVTVRADDGQGREVPRPL